MPVTRTHRRFSFDVNSSRSRVPPRSPRACVSYATASIAEYFHTRQLGGTSVCTSAGRRVIMHRTSHSRHLLHLAPCIFLSLFFTANTQGTQYISDTARAMPAFSTKHERANDKRCGGNIGAAPLVISTTVISFRSFEAPSHFSM